MKPLTLSLLLLTLITVNATGQPNYYSFQKDKSDYAELHHDVQIDSANFGMGDLFSINLQGDTFSFFDKSYIINNSVRIIIFSNSGHMRIDDDSTLIVVDGAFTNLDSINRDTRLSYKIENTGNDKILKVQWKNLSVRTGQRGNYVNFQMWLYKSAGTFEIHYGPCSPNNRYGFTDITGPNIGMLYVSGDFKKVMEKTWLNGDPSFYTVDSARDLSFKAMHGFPESGTVYRFVSKRNLLNVPAIARKDYGIRLYPNPAFSEITVKAEQHLDEPAIISITDLSGRQILSGVMNGNSAGVDLHDIPAGLYHITIKNKDMKHTERLFIRN